jgi:hypothetical protein
VRVGVRVQVGMGVRVAVGVAERASRKACLSAVCVPAVASGRLSGVEVGAVVAVTVTESLVGEERVCELVATGAAVWLANVSI